MIPKEMILSKPVEESLNDAQLNLRQIDSSFESVLENIDPKSGVDLCNFYYLLPLIDLRIYRK